MCQLKSETRFASSWYGGGEIVELDVVMDIRWTTDDQKSYDIVLSFPSFYKLLSSRCLVQSLLKSKLAFRNKLHK